MEQFKMPQFTNELPKTNDFEKQFNEPEILDDLQVLKIKSPEQSGKTPVLFAPGWSRTLDTFKNTLQVLSENGRDTISLNHARSGGEINKNEETANFPEEVQRRATSLKKIIENEISNGNKEINIIAQSMGGMDALVATLLIEAEHPNTIKNIVLVNPAGMIGEDSNLELGKRFIGQMKQNVSIKNDLNRPESAIENVKIAGKEFFKYLKDNPLRAIKEITAMTSMEIEELLIDLKNRGIGISVIHGVDDLTFPMNRVQENASTDQMDGFYSVKGGHNELYLNPDKYMKLAETAISALESKGD